jgi:hypothetical protein
LVNCLITYFLSQNKPKSLFKDSLLLDLRMIKGFFCIGLFLSLWKITYAISNFLCIIYKLTKVVYKKQLIKMQFSLTKNYKLTKKLIYLHKLINKTIQNILLQISKVENSNFNKFRQKCTEYFSLVTK